ncbi:MAG: hypothetical protein MZW92_68075 [Comamonadaceae bacterium]|nr:hypothetical protein [Comamonadaceae bacterium]
MVDRSSEPKSISRETTFERDLHAAPRPRRTVRASSPTCARSVARRPAAQGLRRPHHRHQAALRGLSHQ